MSRAVLRSSSPVTVPLRSTGMPPARLADSRRMRRSPPEQGMLAPAQLQAAPPPPLPNPGSPGPKNKNPINNPEQNLTTQAANAAATIIKAAITTIDPAVQACVDTPNIPNCLLAVLSFPGLFDAGGLEGPALGDDLPPTPASPPPGKPTPAPSAQPGTAPWPTSCPGA
jgi:hypothetical protein